MARFFKSLDTRPDEDFVYGLPQEMMMKVADFADQNMSALSTQFDLVGDGLLSLESLDIPGHQDLLRERQGYYGDQINDLTSQFTKDKANWRKYSGTLKNIGKELSEDLTRGKLRDITSAHKAYKTLAQEIKERDDINEIEGQQILEGYTRQYGESGGLDENGNVRAFGLTLTPTIDLFKRFEEAVKGAREEGIATREVTWDDMMQYQTDKVSKGIPLDRHLEYLTNYVFGSPDVRQSAMQRYQYGVSGYEDMFDPVTGEMNLINMVEHEIQDFDYDENGNVKLDKNKKPIVVTKKIKVPTAYNNAISRALFSTAKKHSGMETVEKRDVKERPSYVTKLNNAHATNMKMIDLQQAYTERAWELSDENNKNIITAFKDEERYWRDKITALEGSLMPEDKKLAEEMRLRLNEGVLSYSEEHQGFIYPDGTLSTNNAKNRQYHNYRLGLPPNTIRVEDPKEFPKGSTIIGRDLYMSPSGQVFTYTHQQREVEEEDTEEGDTEEKKTLIQNKSEDGGSQDEATEVYANHVEAPTTSEKLGATDDETFPNIKKYQTSGMGFEGDNVTSSIVSVPHKEMSFQDLYSLSKADMNYQNAEYTQAYYKIIDDAYQEVKGENEGTFEVALFKKYMVEQVRKGKLHDEGDLERFLQADVTENYARNLEYDRKKYNVMAYDGTTIPYPKVSDPNYKKALNLMGKRYNRLVTTKMKESTTLSANDVYTYPTIPEVRSKLTDELNRGKSHFYYINNSGKRMEIKGDITEASHAFGPNPQSNLGYVVKIDGKEQVIYHKGSTPQSTEHWRNITSRSVGNNVPLRHTLKDDTRMYLLGQINLGMPTKERVVVKQGGEKVNIEGGRSSTVFLDLDNAGANKPYSLIAHPDHSVTLIDYNDPNNVGVKQYPTILHLSNDINNVKKTKQSE